MFLFIQVFGYFTHPGHVYTDLKSINNTIAVIKFLPKEVRTDFWQQVSQNTTSVHFRVLKALNETGIFENFCINASLLGNEEVIPKLIESGVYGLTNQSSFISNWSNALLLDQRQYLFLRHLVLPTNDCLFVLDKSLIAKQFLFSTNLDLETEFFGGDEAKKLFEISSVLTYFYSIQQEYKKFSIILYQNNEIDATQVKNWNEVAWVRRDTYLKIKNGLEFEYKDWISLAKDTVLQKYYFEKNPLEIREEVEVNGVKISKKMHKNLKQNKLGQNERLFLLKFRELCRFYVDLLTKEMFVVDNKIQLEVVLVLFIPQLRELFVLKFKDSIIRINGIKINITQVFFFQDVEFIK